MATWPLDLDLAGIVNGATANASDVTDALDLVETAANDLNTRVNAIPTTATPIVTALPGSPTQGDEIVFSFIAKQGNATATKRGWHLMFDPAGAPNASYPWRVLGAVPIVAATTGQLNIAGNTSGNMYRTDDTSRVTPPLKGIYLFLTQCMLYDAGNGAHYIAPYYNGAIDSAKLYGEGGLGWFIPYAASWEITVTAIDLTTGTRDVEMFHGYAGTNNNNAMGMKRNQITPLWLGA